MSNVGPPDDGDLVASVAAAISGLSPVQRELIRSMVLGEEENTDELLASRFSLSRSAIRKERVLARERLKSYFSARRMG